jgi:hypothetical protein
MKAIAFCAGAVLVLASSVGVNGQSPQRPASVCLNTRDIQRTEPKDDRTIDFYMRDGKVWRNTLRQICPMLKTSAYTQVLQNDQVCSNAQFIHVFQTGNTCTLGDFTRVDTQR